jgi:polyferredoxin
LCPLKITTAFLDIDPIIAKVQLSLFVGIGLIFIIMLPLLTKKRTFCNLICPFGAWQSFFGKISPYRVTINPEKCTQCKKCLEVCPTLAINKESLSVHKILNYCNRCGKCIDACPTKAINFTILNKIQQEPTKKTLFSEIFNPQAVFIFIAILVTGVISNSFVPNAILRLTKALIGG